MIVNYICFFYFQVKKVMEVVGLMLVCLVAGCTAQCNTLKRLVVKKEASVFGTGVYRQDISIRIWKRLYTLEK